MDRWLLGKAHQFENFIPPITRQKVKLIEDSDILTLSEKKELLLMLIGYKYATELALSERKAKDALIKQLGLVSHLKSRIHSKKGRIQWIQVSANPRIDQFIRKHSATMSAMEAGLLYGYPVSAILAFMDLIPRMDKLPKSSYSRRWFGIVRSRHHYRIEEAYFREISKQLSCISPKIASEVK